MFWDKLMGTFKPYESGVRPHDKGSAQPEPERLPAWADAAVEEAPDVAAIEVEPRVVASAVAMKASLRNKLVLGSFQ